MRHFVLIPLLFALVACTTPESTPTTAAPATVSASPVASPAAISASPVSSPAAALSASPAASPAPSNGAVEDASAIQLPSLGSWHDFDRGGGRNVVTADNQKDGAFRARGNAELDRIRTDDVTPTNVAEAHASCTDCQTIAAAVQVVVYRRGATTIAPRNRAVAVNDACTRCVTIARALQWVIPVDDVRAVPRQVAELVRRVDREANYFERIRDLDDVDPREAQARLNQLEADFTSLQQYLSDLQDAKQDNGSPTPSPAASVSASPSPRPATIVPSPSATSR